jgi:phosphate transport system permease protein
LLFNLSYVNGQRQITPDLEYPFGEQGVTLEASHLTHLAVAQNEDYLNVVAVSGRKIQLVRFAVESSFLDDDVSLEEIANQQLSSDIPVDYVLHDPAGHWLYVIARSGELQSYWLEGDELVPNERLKLVKQPSQVTEAKLLLGGHSLMIGDSNGKITQWFPVRNETNTYRLARVRDFDFSTVAVTQIFPEIRRKGFIAIDANNSLGIFYATSHRTLLVESMASLVTEGQQGVTATLNPRGNQMLVASGDRVIRFQVKNEHPELSWSALWSKVWYENYPEPQYTWQSSASTTDFEAKFSLVPLSFGTLKAAFYAMLFAMPLAICGAIFTAYFMAPKMRTLVKPAVEIMEALPTVILGFLAGLWLAPAMENNLPGVFMILLFLPMAIVAFGGLWHWLPTSITRYIPDGWQAALLIPVVVIVSYLCLTFSYPIEKIFFAGDMRVWLGEMGISYDQRNSLVVGIAMGFAVIPTIFSIAEDAIFSVPRHLTSGSLALGASPWQTLVRVVLPTASPGIFSAVMIGLGRAVGETMIVLMATGNTPIMDANIFEGMRTLSANIAVEMPESEVGSSHYRVLFLAGFVLFVFTFVFNTLAENIRHRLRKKYGSL